MYYVQMFGSVNIRGAQIYIEKHLKKEKIALSLASVVSQLGGGGGGIYSSSPLRGDVKISLNC